MDYVRTVRVTSYLVMVMFDYVRWFRLCLTTLESNNFKYVSPDIEGVDLDLTFW